MVRGPLVWVLASALALTFVAGGDASPAGADTHVVASMKHNGFGYTVEHVVADSGGVLTFHNADLRSHDVVSYADGPAGNPWCDRYNNRDCPLFASPLIPLGASTPVDGIDQLTPLSTYEFYCTIHPGMEGTLYAI